MLRHHGSPEVAVGLVLVVGVAHETDISQRVLAAQGIRKSVVVLEPVSFLAPLTRGVGVAAAPFVAIVDGALQGRGNVAIGRGRVFRQRLLPRCLREAEALSFEALQLLGHGSLDHLGQVGRHQLLEALQLPPQIRAGRELHFVAFGSEGLDDGS
jgi:hypothetical protein